MQKLLTKFPGLATSGRHNSAMTTDRRKFTTNWPSTGCLVSILHLESIQSLSPALYCFRQRPMSDVAYQNRLRITPDYAAVLVRPGNQYMEEIKEKQTELEPENK